MQALISCLESQNKIVDCDLSAILQTKMSSLLPLCEKHDIDQQTHLHQKWVTDRAADIAKQIKDFETQQRKIAIAQRLSDLQQTEEKLRYFEQEQKIKLGIKRQPLIRPIEDEIEQEQFVAAPTERSKKK